MSQKQQAVKSVKELKILTYPHPVLDQVAQEVKFPLSHEVQELIQAMWATVDGKGVGLAAPQVGSSLQICIIHLGDLAKKNQASSFVMINPKITFFSAIEVEMVEGCLSFPDEFYSIYRPANITVEYFDQNAKKHKLNARDWLSRVIQHEIDHLNGKLFINMGGQKLDPSEIDQDQIVD